MKIEFDTTPEMDAEIERLLKETSLKSPAELFQVGFTLLRIHVDAKQKGAYIKMFQWQDEYDVRLPFEVKGE